MRGGEGVGKDLDTYLVWPEGGQLDHVEGQQESWIQAVPEAPQGGAWNLVSRRTPVPEDNMADAYPRRRISSVAHAPAGKGARHTCARSAHLPHVFSIQVFTALSSALGPAPHPPANPRAPATPRPMRSLPARALPRRLHLQPRRVDALRCWVTCTCPRSPGPPLCSCGYWKGQRPGCLSRGQACTWPGPAPGIALSGGGTFFTCAPPAPRPPPQSSLRPFNLYG